MYRHATMRLRCHACGAEQPQPALTLSPLGGHLCWRCEVRAQIADHEANARPRRSSPARAPRQPLGPLAQFFCAFALILFMLGFIGAVGLLLMFTGHGSC